MKQDTIAAIATAMSNSGIGIVRISGEDAISIVDKVYKSKKENKKLAYVDSHTIHYGYIYDHNELIDEVMVLIMKGPNSYTKEDSVEIDCHGGILVVQRVLEIVIKNGARCAEPGEFTKRAFLNGRIDLSQAEAVIDIINSKNNFALKNSLSQLKGVIHDKIKDIREKLIYHIAFIEAALDDPEHISLEGYNEQLIKTVNEIISNLEIILVKADDGKILKEGIKTVIIGKPNVGKSSLLNYLVGEEKAIVTNIAGTTRDIIEENINLNGLSLNIIDTAGIRKTEDIVEKIGVEKAIQNASDADLIIYIVDSSTKLDENDEQILELLKDKKAIILLNKTDLNIVTSEEIIRKKTDCIVIPVSIKEKNGVELLQASIKKMFMKGNIEYNDEIYITNIRQKSLISEAFESLKLVKNSINENMPEDFYSIDLMDAYDKLGQVIGESMEDDLVNQIFSKFCMGK
ncbi:tRNA modification GTPase [Lachnotalea glycerini]|uniref:tRNA modification GTPase MnmE n=1 Tax=Lachnotalea glycerini TaxID=1763509 RepID=A0A318EGV1_9FIRM|nr:tRNA uridine-5-carboxymethylaminomethyl(34) synthesis GTPase MnmE [Lachnotalea glycerini]PXV85334.1 tRNA modification GTPase [Lachnotalea glycerini]RDY30221.1 tRNA uridine-5-carboxymethylaminomethyl(34) synthesis GTPase MnmE [Lachnotalea glycerini]